MPDKRLLLLSPYDTSSHRRWREGLVAQFPQHQWTVLTLPPRWFAWRIRGNSLSWGIGERARLQAGHDAIIATSMTDLAALRGLVPALAATPCLLYFHENQFAYPDSEHHHPPGIEAQLVPVYSALAAQRLAFNSNWNRDSFMAGARRLLKKMPDAVPPGLVDDIAARSELLPVPLGPQWFGQRDPHADSGPLRLLWNHRWEYDKAPERLFAALALLRQRGIDFRLQLLGQRFRRCPAIFEQARPSLHQHIDQWGPLPHEADYRAALLNADVVVSTSLHEFQGLAVLEAVAAGCLPLVPDRLAYRETIPAHCRYPSFPDDGEQEATVLADRLSQLAAAKQRQQLPPAPDISPLSWRRLAPRYAEIINSL